MANQASDGSMIRERPGAPVLSSFVFLEQDAKAEKSWRFLPPRHSAGSDGVGDGCCDATVGLLTDYRVRCLVASPKDAPAAIGHITLRGKCNQERVARESRTLRADVAGAGNGLTVRLVRHSHRKRGETDRPRLRSTAPALDPTGQRKLASEWGVLSISGARLVRGWWRRCSRPE